MAEALQFVSFFLDGQRYGVDIRTVREINPTLSLAPVPRTRPYIRGLVNIRGQVVLVIDVAVILGKPPRPITEESRVVILKTTSELARVRGLDRAVDIDLYGDKPVGFVVDAVADVVQVPVDSVTATPGHVEETHTKYYQGVVRVDGELQLVLDAGVLLSGGGTELS